MTEVMKEEDLISKYVTRTTKSSGGAGRVVELIADVKGRPLPHMIKYNSRLLEEVSCLPEWNENDWDTWGLIVGKPGVGKTILASKTALLLDYTFSLDNIFFTQEQFEEWIDKAPPFSVGLFDEADALAEHHSSKKIRMLIKNSKRIRTKNLYVLLSTPTLSDLNKHFIYRATFILYIPKYGPCDRGYFYYYTGEDNLWDLYYGLKDYGEKQSVYKKYCRVIRNGYSGRDKMEDWFIDSDAYDKKKEDARRAAEKEDKSNKSVLLEQRRRAVIYFRRLYEGNNINSKQFPFFKHMGAAFGVHCSAITNDLKTASMHKVKTDNNEVKYLES